MGSFGRGDACCWARCEVSGSGGKAIGAAPWESMDLEEQELGGGSGSERVASEWLAW
jgi:hypothetical protein